ncbi:MAG: beta-galactosidase [Chitinophagaceae bacterium]|nr:beta-galactosidase [Chitinophagaceae bacterium]MCW5929558.1 beta-galactosidase [Chitinophagaceae bacterium]
MRLNLLISCLFYLITTVKLYAGTADTTQIPVLAWGGVPPHEASIERYKEMREAGLMVSLTRSTTIDSMAMMLDMAAKAGVQLIVRCPELQTDPENTVRRFMNHPATAGYFLKDEPSAKEFPYLGKWMKSIQTVDSQHQYYINLFPNYAVPQQLGADTYQQYLDEFMAVVAPPVLSFDHYPVIETKGLRHLRNEWFENLEMVANTAQKNNKPFWAFALSVAHGPYPVPTLAEIRLQVFANLAYGAQGIQYFTYWTPRNRSKYTYYHGPIDSNNKRTDVYEMIKTVNREIQGLSGIFLSAKVISVGHTGENIPAGTQRLIEPPKGIKKLRTKGEGAIVSLIENDKQHYAIIVNRDFKQSMKLYIKGNGKLESVRKDSDQPESKSKTFALVIAPGDIAVFRIKH